jgi:iron complex transport system ATP-binding protein
MDAELTALDVALTGFFGTLGLYDPVKAPMREQSLEILDRVGLHAVSDHRFGTLSSGERMRCLIARALVVRPQLLLLDEPTAGLDLLAREQVLATVQALFENDPSPPTVVFITHHLDALQAATSSLLLLSDGRAEAQGAPSQVLLDDVLSPVYGCPVQVTRSGGRYYTQVHPQAWASLLKRRSTV